MVQRLYLNWELAQFIKLYLKFINSRFGVLTIYGFLFTWNLSNI